MSIADRFALDGRTALVTGSTQGIGLAIARGLAEAGAGVAFHGLEPNSEAAAAVRSAPRGSTMLTGDLGEPGVPKQLVLDAIEALGALDVIVHCASVERRTAWLEIDREQAEAQFRVNCWAALELFQAAAPAMQARSWGRLIAIGSVQQSKPHPDMLAYAASKSALAAVVRGLAHQLAPSGITANTIAPGVVETPRTASVLADEGYAGRVAASIPLGRFGVPEDIVGTTLLLACDAGAYITGQTIFIDGLKSF